MDGAEFPGFVSSDLDEAVEHAVLLHDDKTVWDEKVLLCGAVLRASYDEKSTLEPLEEKVNSILQNLPDQRRSNPVGRVLWHQSFRSTEYFSRWIQTKQELSEVRQSQ